MESLPGLGGADRSGGRERSAPERLVGLVVVAAVAVAAWVMITRAMSLLPLEAHLRDDAYYYFCWARSLAAGDGPCVTAGVPTSGVHPLWALWLTCLALFGAGEALPWLAVGSGYVLHVFTAALIVAAAGPRRGFGLCVAAIWAGVPFLVEEAGNGQETALASGALAVFCLWHRRSPAHFFGTGLLVVAARSDLLILVAALAMAEPRWRALRVTAVGMIFACYAGWNLLLAGHWLQDSATPMAWLVAETLRDDIARGVTTWPAHFFGHLHPLLLLVPLRLGSTVLVLAWLIAAIVAAAAGDRGAGRRREWGLAWALAGAIGLAAFHHLWRGYPRDYYFAPCAVIGALALVRLAAPLPRTALALATLAVAWNAWHAVDPVRGHPAQRDMALAGRHVGRFLPEGARLGCFNSGIVTWYHGGAVVNLDGVVNRDAFTALAAHDLAGYLRREGIAYLLDNPVQFQRHGIHANGRFFAPDFAAERDLRECVRFWTPGDRSPRRPGTGSFRLYRWRDGDDIRWPEWDAADLGPAPGGGRTVGWKAAAEATLRYRYSSPSSVGVVAGGERGVDGRGGVLRSDRALVHVLSLPWDRRTRLSLFPGETGDAAQPILIVAPE